MPSEQLQSLLHEVGSAPIAAGLTPLMIAARLPDRPTDAPFQELLVKGLALDLVQRSADGGKNIFHVLCCTQHNVELLSSNLSALLSLAGAAEAVHNADDAGRIPLHWACLNSSFGLPMLAQMLEATRPALHELQMLPWWLVHADPVAGDPLVHVHSFVEQTRLRVVVGDVDWY